MSKMSKAKLLDLRPVEAERGVWLDLSEVTVNSSRVCRPC